MRRFLFLFFGFPVLLLGFRVTFFQEKFSLYVLYIGLVIWGIVLAIYFAKLPQKKT